jgi:hypothetical protein
MAAKALHLAIFLQYKQRDAEQSGVSLFLRTINLFYTF